MAPPVFKVGDRVRYTITLRGKTHTALGTIVRSPKTARGKLYSVAFDEGTVLHGQRYGPEHRDEECAGPQSIWLENLEPANESPVTTTSK